jgi:hypothetical protein
MSYVVYNKTTWRLMKLKNGVQYFDTRRAAQAARTRFFNTATDLDPNHDWAIETVMQYNADMPDRQTYNLFDKSRKPIWIRACNIGTHLDPATESYHSM